MQGKDIRDCFLNFFREKGHAIVPSAPLVIKNDPTLMFTNAGMNQFKDYFLGNAIPGHKRIANTQKCLRVSGKHNDLEEVGVDTYHHTMFEMLGNWSFGDYFKKEAIEWAWELLVNIYKIDSNRIYVTVFGGDQQDNLSSDTDAIEIWKKVIGEDRILQCGKKDNFWEMADTGPCGPCSEIHVDIRNDRERKKIDGKTLVNKGNPEVIEIWNLVFIEFNRLAGGKLEQLSQKHVDTGMGLERLCMVLQKKKSNYDTDVFLPLIREIEKKSSRKYGTTWGNPHLDVIFGVSDSVQQKTDIAIRVIADHVRAVAFSIADGQLPSNTGAGYVIRRILRRAVRYGYSFLEMKEPFIYKLVPKIAETLGLQFNELIAGQHLIEKVILEEEESFIRTLEAGIKKFSNAGKVIDGRFAFELYDTYGFPIDLTQLMAKEQNIEVDMQGFKKEMDKQKSRSRKAAVIDTGDWTELIKAAESVFTGYDSPEAEVKILKYRKVKTKGKEQYQLVFDKTPFYAESGGQVGDTGIIKTGGEKIILNDTKKENTLIIHFTDKLPSDTGASFHACVDSKKRKLTANNHSATHLLHAALRETLGTHVEQKGSLVHPDYLRFDFSYFQKVADEELKRIEAIVNQKIRENIPLDEKREIPVKQAKEMGAMALFGEKYSEKVRVIRFGDSIELCGGIHVPFTGQIGLFKIVSESAIAAGIRRIEAITALKAEEYVNKQLQELAEIKDVLKFPKEVVKGVLALHDQNSKLRKQIEELVNEKVKNIKEDLLKKAKAENGITYIIEKVELNTADAVKNLAYLLSGSVENLILALGAKVEDKAHLAILISEKLSKANKLDASAIIREAAHEIQGGGGGQPFFATAGGKDVGGIPAALKKIREIFCDNLINPTC